MDGGVSKEHVLVVDDEPQILVALEDLLGDDFTILKSETPEGALAFVERDPNIAVVITDQRSARNGDIIENIGNHNPRTRPITDVVDEARALYWLSVGAQPTEAITSVFKRTGTLERFERLKKGESMDALVAEAKAAFAALPPVSPRTSYPSPGPGEGTFKPKAE